MKLTEQQYNQLLNNPNVPQELLKELSNKARKESWSFVGT
jgi:hypothetical protein